jgi:two-component system phosphate regulon sensor histidine kinase PhoR
MTTILIILCLVLTVSLIIVTVAQLRGRQSVARMTQQNQQMLRTLIKRRDELEAALSSMVESVMAVDTDRRVISLNDAAAHLLNVRAEDAIGQRINDVVKSDPLRRVLEEAVVATQPVQADVEISVGAEGEPPRLFQAQGAVLRDSEGRRVGSVLVLHDVTRLRRLEVVRRDFVANASHEIKTPVTAIKAAAETLIQSDGDDPEAQNHFLQVILRQANRLQAIVEDLLSLARIEQDTEHSRVALEVGVVREVMNAAVETVTALANSRGTRIETDCPPELRISMNPPLLEQALVNLLENAIKYSPENSVVKLTADEQAGEVVLSIIDKGVGISAEHLPRIFERFYRTDKARSRAAGGTGLGLSIVKHIAIAHGGRVSVESAVGKGSTFRVHLPK